MNPLKHLKNRKQRRLEAAQVRSGVRKLDDIQAEFNQKSFQLGNLFYQSGMIKGQFDKINAEIEVLMKAMEELSKEGYELKQKAVAEEIEKGKAAQAEAPSAPVEQKA
jgi:chromosome segregation ATPase